MLTAGLRARHPHTHTHTLLHPLPVTRETRARAALREPAFIGPASVFCSLALQIRRSRFSFPWSLLLFVPVFVLPSTRFFSGQKLESVLCFSRYAAGASACSESVAAEEQVLAELGGGALGLPATVTTTTTTNGANGGGA